MRTRIHRTGLIVWGILSIALHRVGAFAGDQPATAHRPSLTQAEIAAGWKLLFDGTSAAGWRAYRGEKFPEQGWEIRDGCLHLRPGRGGGDLVTVEMFGDFELSFEYRTAPGANSGVMYRVSEEYEAPWMSGPEFQILDDAGAGEAADSPHSAGAVFDLVSPAEGKLLRPAGEFNEARIRLRSGLLQHWLNGVKIIERRVDDQAWRSTIASSKFRSYKNFALAPRGHLCLQDHGDEVWFRNLRVRDLSAALPAEVRLFNGTDLTGWTAVLPEGGTMAEVWSVQDGVLVCRGTPTGYIRTQQTYTNYVLRLEWRFNPVTRQAGNSGVLLRVVGPDKVWPRSVEAQLQSGNAGDFWNIDDFPMKTDPERTSGRNTRKSHAAERPVGEWNEYEIIVDHDTVTLNVNGEALNRAWDVWETPGWIALQSEGAEIHFRDIRLAPIP